MKAPVYAAVSGVCACDRLYIAVEEGAFKLQNGGIFSNEHLLDFIMDMISSLSRQVKWWLLHRLSLFGVSESV